jgi:ribonuclease PH
VKFAPFSVTSWSGQDGKLDSIEKQLSVVMRHALTACVDADTFPKCTVDVHVQVLQADGGGQLESALVQLRQYFVCHCYFAVLCA